MVTLTATVAAGTVNVHPGLVLFCESTAVVCSELTAVGSAQLTSAGTATFAARLSVGSHDVRAIFVGTHLYGSSSSPPRSIFVNSGQAATSTGLYGSDLPGALQLVATVISNTGPTAASGLTNFVDVKSGSVVTSAMLGDPLPYQGAITPALSGGGDCLCFPNAVVTADFTTSGFPDLAIVANDALDPPHRLHILLNTATGRISEQYSLNLPFNAVLLGAGDLNGDGHPDLIAAAADGTILPLLGKGSGDFRAAPSIETSVVPNSLVVEDFNGDGNLDVLVGDAGGVVTLLSGIGDGTFTLQHASTGAIGNLLAVADFNGDGRPDLAASEVSSNSVDVFLGNGDGTFSPKSVSGAIPGPGTPVASDFNGDGNADLAIPAMGGSSVVVLLGKGDGTFDAPISIPVSNTGSTVRPLALAAGNFNGDGLADLVMLVDTTSPSDPFYPLEVLLGSRDGTFVRDEIDLIQEHSPLAVADFDGYGLSGAFVGSHVHSVTLSSTASAAWTFAEDAYVEAVYSGDATHGGSRSQVAFVPGTPIDFAQGFSGAASQLTLNGASIQGTVLRLTDGGMSERRSAFFRQRVPIATTSGAPIVNAFDFQLTGATKPTPDADGFAYVITGNGPDALGSAGGGLGYGPSSLGQTGKSITNSVAVKFDLHNNDGEGTSSIGIYQNGTAPTVPAVDLRPYGIDLHSGHVFHVTLYFNPLNISITDQTTGATYDEVSDLSIAGIVGGTTAYVGFTAGTGGLSAVQDILNWTFQSSTSYFNNVVQYPSFMDTTLLTFNGGGSVAGGVLNVNDGSAFSKSSVFYKPKVPLDVFTIDFDYQLNGGTGEGFTFVMQSEGLKALGSAGGGLGYATDLPGRAGPQITHSVAVKFDLHNNAGEGDNSTGVYLEGASPTTPALDLTASGINLHSGDPFHVRLSYDGTTLTENITDLSNYAVFSHSYAVDIPGTVGAQGFIGFTAGTGALSESVKVQNWSMTHNYLF